ncbi:MAG: 2Fe-2S iron-sulfur cluster binding domain-containing protein [Myxococcales bacterium]|nr:2Fe-2S iron-sulfur cluster binding domain-containing protein [Myxococcales bacterium]MCB9714237.1 2Fe-2S iron-sulfur cluster binding domain-containing protein [Myxococcales bacterium]
MATVRYGDHRVPLAPGETVLDGLLRAGADVAHACRSGACKACALQAAPGSVPEAAQQGLRASERRRGVFLACQCRPQADLEVHAADHADEVGAEVIEVAPLSATVTRLRLRPDSPLSHRAGQYVAMRRADGLTRSYSIASLPQEPWVELHVGLVPGGQMSRWVVQQARPGDRVSLRGPYGDCVYVPEEPQAPLLLVGVGTGVAPLWGVAREAVAAEHRGPIVVIEAAATPAGLYLHEPWRALARAHERVELLSCVLAGGDRGELREAPVDAVAGERFRELGAPKDAFALLCGDPPIVHRLRRGLFLAGLSSRRIFADAFVMGPPPASREASMAV